ncbi:variable large family protein (plasmid) [Borrelia puertoricensis]|uniref:variable large family protein n=1 Tax=Borrelia puertoricensis TaxID=2756107 RepID=UPI003EB71B6B
MKRITLCALLITLFLLLGCDSGQQSVDLPNGGGAATGGSSLSSVISSSRRLFLDAFVSFGGLLKEAFGLTADTSSVKGIVEGINLIYEAVKDVGTEPKGNAKKIIDDSKEISKLFKGTGDVGGDAKSLSGASKAVIAASGADILAAIEAAKDTSKAAAQISAAKNAYDIAVATKDDSNASDDIKTNASAIAAGLALRAMAKDGKLATVATHAPGQAVNAVLIGAVSKTVNEIISTIRRAVDKFLKDVDDCIKEDFSSVVTLK